MFTILLSVIGEEVGQDRQTQNHSFIKPESAVNQIRSESDDLLG